MNINKPHFWYNKRQRNGVFYFLLVIISLQILIFYFDDIWRSDTDEFVEEVSLLQAKVDSLQQLSNSKKKIYKFNPNFISDEKGYAIGMSVSEIDRLLEYRSNGLWVNDLKSFQRVTLVSDSLLMVLAPYFAFPKFKKVKKAIQKIKKPLVKEDLNSVDSIQLKTIPGVGKILSARIVKYRNKLGGFLVEGQLHEVYGLSAEVCNKILQKYEIKTVPRITKINVNTASFKEVLSIVYLDYETTKVIFNYKNEVGRIENLLELKKIARFPIDKFERIALYLHAK